MAKDVEKKGGWSGLSMVGGRWISEEPAEKILGRRAMEGTSRMSDDGRRKAQPGTTGESAEDSERGFSGVWSVWRREIGKR